MHKCIFSVYFLFRDEVSREKKVSGNMRKVKYLLGFVMAAKVGRTPPLQIREP